MKMFQNQRVVMVEKLCKYTKKKNTELYTLRGQILYVNYISRNSLNSYIEGLTTQ